MNNFDNMQQKYDDSQDFFNSGNFDDELEEYDEDLKEYIEELERLEGILEEVDYDEYKGIEIEEQTAEEELEEMMDDEIIPDDEYDFSKYYELENGDIVEDSNPRPKWLP